MSRFNLKLLRDLTKAGRKPGYPPSPPAGVTLSRRSFLTLSGAGVAFSAVPSFLRKDGFSLIRDGSRLHFISDGERRWTIDPEHFGDKAELAVSDTGNKVLVRLRNGIFPGTESVADFDCTLSKPFSAWILELSFECGIQVSAPLLEWLKGVRPAIGAWRKSQFNPFQGLSILIHSYPAVWFSPDWTFTAHGPATISLQHLAEPLPCSRFLLAVNAPQTLTGATPKRSTTVRVERQDANWNINLSRQSDHGWSLHHSGENIFDELWVEAAETDEEIVRTAMLHQAIDNSVLLGFHPGGSLCTDSGGPFTMSLSNTRLAFGLEENSTSALISDLSREPVWAHAEEASYLLCPLPDAPHFELHEDPETIPVPQVMPGLCQVCFPSDETCINLKMGVPRPVPFTWGKLFAPFERFWGWLHLLPSQHGKGLVINLERGDALCVDRPRDLLSLKFQFEHMRLITGIRPRIVHVRGQGDPRVIVKFPPQHVTEKAYFRTHISGFANDPPVGLVELAEYNNGNTSNPITLPQLQKILDPDFGNPSDEKDEAVPPVRIAAESQLVFGLPTHDWEIPCETDALLDWSRWQPIVAPAAKIITITNINQIPPIVDPADPKGPQYTAVEMPWHLDLSPSDQGRWAHSVNPVESSEKVVELWHTRLGVRPQPGSAASKPTNKIDKQQQCPEVVEAPSSGKAMPVDEANQKDRFVRAIWSPDFVTPKSAELTCTPELDSKKIPAPFPAHYQPGTATPADPFRMTLDARDRCELVHLTSNYGIPAQANFCKNGEPIPSTPDDLLKPAPVQVGLMMLTAMGGYLESLGQWSPGKIDQNHQLTVQLWAHSATLGRDHFVKVIYKGYLMPFGLSASLVKLTLREFVLGPNGNYVAILHQYMYIVVKDQAKSCPILGQPFDGRAFPFSLVEPVTLQTPLLDPPSNQTWMPHGPLQHQTLFWPMVNNQPFQFRVRFTDVTRSHILESSMPLVFVSSDVAQRDGFGDGTTTPPTWASQDAVRLYNGGFAEVSSGSTPKLDDPWLTASFDNNTISFAKSSTPGNTDFDTQSISWRATALMAQVNVVLSGVTGSFTLTFIETNSGTTFVENFGSATKGSVSVNSGLYIVTVMSTINGKTNSATTPAFPFVGNSQYTLTIPLKPDGSGFSSPPTSKWDSSIGLSPTELYQGDLPYFYPVVDSANITSASIKRITGILTAKRFVFYPGYLSSGFDSAANPGEVLLQKHPTDTLTLSFGASGQVDKAGGLASPDALVVGFSRKAGVIGGKMASAVLNGASQSLPSLDTFSGGKFDPSDFFGGLSSAKLLGAVKLSDIIAAIAPGVVSNLVKAPVMLQQALYNLEGATLDLAVDIDNFQKLPENALATHLSGQAQQVAAAAATLRGVVTGDPLTAGIAEAQLVARITDYAAALRSALQDPASLIEDEILVLLKKAVSGIFASATDTITGILTTISGQFTQALEDLLVSGAASLDAALTGLANKLGNKIKDDLTNAEQPLAVLATDVSSLVSVEKQVSALRGNIQQLGASISQAAADLKKTPPSAQQLPRIAADANTIMATMSQVYEKAGFLVSVAVDLKNPNLKFPDTLTSLKTTLLDFWRKPYAAPPPDLSDLQNYCVILAAAWDPATGQQILQTLRQLQKYVSQAAAFANQPLPSSLTNDYRRLQTLQKMQGQILRAIVELQDLAQKTPPPITSPTTAATTQSAIAQIKAALPPLAITLTVAQNLITDKTIEQMLGPLVTVLAGPLTAASNDLQRQLAMLRSQINQNAVDLRLLLLHYNLSIDYQRPFRAALSYAIYLEDAALEAQASAIAGIEKLTSTAAAALCQLGGVWTSFRNKLKTLPGSDISLPPSNMPLGTVIDSMFSQDLNAIDTAFANICDPKQTSPSLLLRNSKALVATFANLESAIRAKITNVPALLQALKDALKQEAQHLMENLLSQLHIPTSINLSYTWNPDIQSCEPVFIVDPEATFTVKATAKAGLNLQSSTAQASFDITATLTNFEIRLISETPFITLAFSELVFTSQNGSKVDCRATLKDVKFGDPMTFVQKLADILNPSQGPFIELSRGSIRAGFRFGISSLTMGAFNLMQLAIEVAVALPFDGTPVRCEFNLSDQQHPFLLSSGIFGGGGFLQLQLGLDGVQLLQGAFEFGVCASISIGPLSGSGFVVAGIYFLVTGTSSEVCGFVHAHGHMDIFGIISMDVDLYVGICYDQGQVQGTATFSVSISIAFFSETFTMQAHYGFSSQDTQSSTLYTNPDYTEAFLVTPEDRLYIDAPKEDYCGNGKATPQFVDPTVWANYYNSFA